MTETLKLVPKTAAHVSDAKTAGTEWAVLRKAVRQSRRVTRMVLFVAA